MDEFEKRLRSIDWPKYSGPEHYRPQELIASVLELFQLTEPDHLNKVYNRVLSAVGNNHAGTYYPAILEAMNFIDEIATNKRHEHASHVASEVLIDLRESFHAEVGSYREHTAGQIEHFVQNFNVRY